MLELIGLLALLLGAVFWLPWIMKSGRFGAPFVPMEPEVVERVMRLAEIKKGEVFYDLGSGDGRLVIAAALRGAQAFGVEIDWLRVFYSRLWIKLLRLSRNARIIHQDFFEVNLSKADVVSLFLLQETNNKLEEKLRKELRKEARIISYAFNFKSLKLLKTYSVQGKFGPIHLYQI